MDYTQISTEVLKERKEDVELRIKSLEWIGGQEDEYKEMKEEQEAISRVLKERGIA